MEYGSYDFRQFQCEIACESILGTREEQQDSYCVSRNRDSVLAVVCDGMGGLSQGQLASSIASGEISRLFQEKSAQTEFPAFFENAADLMDEAVSSLRKREETMRAGTTIVAATIEEGNLYWLSCGDSRLYIVRDHEIAQITRDHNYKLELDALYQQGKIDEMEYNRELHRGENLISYIGMGGIDILDINTTPFPLEDGDLLLLASDGLYRHLSGQDILNIMVSAEEVNQIAETLLKEATRLSKKSQDNTTIIVLRYRRKTA